MDWELKVLSAEAGRLIALAAENEALRVKLRALAEHILAETQAGAGREPKPETERETAARPEIETAPKLEAKPVARPEIETAPKLEAKPAARPEIEAAPKLEAPPRPAREQSREREPLRRLTLGQAVRPPFDPRSSSRARSSSSSEASRAAAPVGSAALERDEGPLADAERRCRTKAAAARWAAAHERWLEAGADLEIEPTAPGPAITRWADMFLNDQYWRTRDDDDDDDGGDEGRHDAPTVDAGAFERLGGCYEALAETLALARGLFAAAERARTGRSSSSPSSPARRAMHEALQLAAEAQSALRAAAQQARAQPDPDQIEAFHWTKNQALRDNYYIQRYMRTEDAADPERWADLVERARRLQARHGLRGEGSGGGDPFRAGLDRLRSLLAKKPAKADESAKADERAKPDEGAERDWPAIVETVDDLVERGLPPSDLELRALLMPSIEKLPDLDEPPRGFQLVLRALDQAAAAQAEAEAEEKARAGGGEDGSGASPEVKEAARLLAGKTIVLIGGDRRAFAEAALKKALALKELVWVEARAHQSLATFEPFVFRPEVALVLLAIRWSSHSFGEVKAFCERYGKPLVRLPGGYSPNQVAAQVLAQCGKQLAGE